MQTRTYHWKHGWIPLDHQAALSKAHGSRAGAAKFHPVAQAHVARESHITIAHDGGKFLVHDTKTGNATSLSNGRALTLHDSGHVITAVHADGAVETRVDMAAAKAEAAKRVAEAKAAEPKLTAAMQALADRFHGKLAGLEFRLKGEDSLARKIAADVAETKPPPPPSPARAAAKMFDVNRYTMVHPEGEYANRVQGALDHLRGQGYTLNVKNYWTVSSNPYKGINVQVTAPDGHKFELQFHTPQSLDVKEGALHSLYEKRRTEPNAAAAALLDAQMFAVAAKITDPAGVAAVS